MWVPPQIIRLLWMPPKILSSLTNKDLPKFFFYPPKIFQSPLSLEIWSTFQFLSCLPAVVSLLNSFCLLFRSLLPSCQLVFLQMNFVSLWTNGRCPIRSSILIIVAFKTKGLNFYCLKWYAPKIKTFFIVQKIDVIRKYRASFPKFKMKNFLFVLFYHLKGLT